MPKLTIDTKASLYEPLEIEIDGEIYEVQQLNESLIEQLTILDERVRNGELSAAYERLRILLGSHNFIGQLKLFHVKDITNFIIENIFTPKKQEKNEQGPGPKELP